MKAILLKVLMHKFTGKLGLALARVFVKRTKTKVDDEIMIDLGLMEKENK